MYIAIVWKYGYTQQKQLLRAPNFYQFVNNGFELYQTLPKEKLKAIFSVNFLHVYPRIKKVCNCVFGAQANIMVVIVS